MAGLAVGGYILALLQLLPGPAVGVQKVDSVIEKITKEKFDIAHEKLTKEKFDISQEKVTKEKYEIAHEKLIKEKYDRKEGRTSGRTTRLTKEGLLEQSGDKTDIGKMNKAGVIHYKRSTFKKSTGQGGKLFWPDSVNREGQLYSGAVDFTENLSWGWHHPSGVYNTIPVGSPLIDDDRNIYLGADDAIRKFDVTGILKWSYAPRGQLAAAPTLCIATSRRQAAAENDDEMEEDELRPDWAVGNESMQSSKFFREFKVGDLVKVKPGSSYRADGKELYKAGDQGLISGVVTGEEGRDRAVIQWTRTGHKSVVQLRAFSNRFVRVAPKQTAATSPSMLVGSTTAGYVFALDLATGDELWATWASNEIAGVKGAVACKGGIVVVATDRCTDRYCYRYRNQTNPLTPGNQVVRGLSAVDGSAVWAYRTMAPVWNMVPLWGPGDTVMFQDWEGRLYSLDYLTGELHYKVGGDIGTHTNAAAVYDAGWNMVFALGMVHYNVMNYHMEDALGIPTGKYCNPYPAPGILINCWTWPGGRGFVRGYNASSGRNAWERLTPEPPASGAVGMLNGHGSIGVGAHSRLVVTMAFNCWVNSPSQIWSLDPNNGDVRWMRDGPTLWTNFCAGDKEGADIRRAMGGRAACKPNSWSTPVIDSAGDVYVGNQVGVLSRYGAPNGGGSRDVQVLSTLTTGVAFQDAAIAIADGLMAVSTCTSLIVFQTYADQLPNGTGSVSHADYSPSAGMVHGDEASHEISETAHDHWADPFNAR
ncbi:unnamed protein product [Prorocentrum cordatum]|uniref:Pyrrolo-quinoline quinone repeat domain-containing protein n=1 Tax=Prorocentrum cordatum TaxID=2364126 RepID=A0ABN9QRV0_9DINO|nr:unnamed protein product [Polarella glacialis]